MTKNEASMKHNREVVRRNHQSDSKDRALQTPKENKIVVVELDNLGKKLVDESN